MRILYVVSNADLNPRSNTGYGRHIRETVLNLKELGHSVAVFSSHHGRIIEIHESYVKQVSQDVPVNSLISVVKTVLPKIFWQTIRDFRTILREKSNEQKIIGNIRSLETDIVFERSSYMSIAAANAASKSGKPLYLEINSPFVEQQKKLSGASLLNGFAHRREITKGKLMTRGYCVSQVLIDFHVKHYGYPQNSLRSIPNAVDSSWLEHKNDTKVSNDHTITIGFVGSILEYHGVDMLISAFSNLQEQFEYVRLLIVGDGHMLPEYKSQVAKLGIVEKVRFTGSVPHQRVPELIDQMDICVNPMHSWYGSPIKLFEYGALGKAIVASNQKPVAEVIENEIDGLLIESSISNLHNALVRLISNQDIRKTLANSFHQKVKLKHTWQYNIGLINKDLESVFENE